jgi:hypothetical protein
MALVLHVLNGFNLHLCVSTTHVRRGLVENHISQKKRLEKTLKIGKIRERLVTY